MSATQKPEGRPRVTKKEGKASEDKGQIDTPDEEFVSAKETDEGKVNKNSATKHFKFFLQ